VTYDGQHVWASLKGSDKTHNIDSDEGAAEFGKELGDKKSEKNGKGLDLSQNCQRCFYSASDGRASHGWENPNNHNQGYGYRIHVASADGTKYIYAHVDPSSVAVGINEQVSKGQLLGQYADPPNGTASGPHLHVEHRGAKGEVLDAKNSLSTIMPNHDVTSQMG
jgi:murein DD-endopeptidase MepM/ murein hydrolase activator NlpD